MEAGLLPGDEIVTLNGTRIASIAALENALDGIGETAELVISRGGMMKTLTLAAKPDPRPEIRLQIDGDSELREGWLRRDG